MRWNNHKTQFLADDADAHLINQMPQRVQLAIFKDFIFSDFCIKFNRLLRFKNNVHETKVNLQLDNLLSSTPFSRRSCSMEHSHSGRMHSRGKSNEGQSRRDDADSPKQGKYCKTYQSFYSLNDFEYRQFLLMLMQSLEPREFQPRQIIYEELDDAGEMLFVMRGTYNVGYLVN